MKVAYVIDPHLSDSTPRSRIDNYLDSTLRELDEVYKIVDRVVFLGDLFHKPSLNTQTLNILYKYFIGKKEEGKITDTIVGNHDIYNMSVQSLEKTAMGLLGEVGAFNIRRETFEIGGIKHYIIPMEKIPVIPTSSGGSICLGHCFLERSEDMDFSLKSEDIEKAGHRVLILGHDHEPFPPKKIGATTVIRMGAFGRNTSHEYNLTRKPVVLILEIVEGKIILSKFQEVTSARVGREIFREEVFTSNKTTKRFLTNVREFLDGYRSRSNLKVTVGHALNELNAPPEVLEYIRSVHTGLNIGY